MEKKLSSSLLTPKIRRILLTDLTSEHVQAIIGSVNSLGFCTRIDENYFWEVLIGKKTHSMIESELLRAWSQIEMHKALKSQGILDDNDDDEPEHE